jgi:hypothetical protein
VETDRLPSNVRDRTIQAVNSLGRRVTVGDVAAQAGLKLDEAERALQALAADTDGFLEVTLVKINRRKIGSLNNLHPKERFICSSASYKILESNPSRGA